MKITDPKINFNFSNLNNEIYEFDARKFRSEHFYKNYWNDRRRTFENYKKFILKHNKPCPLCKSTKTKTFLKLENKYKLNECLKCSLVFPNIDLEALSINEKKKKNISPYIKNRSVYKKTLKYRIETFGVQRINYLIDNLKLKKKHRVLDMGCGHGNFLATLDHFGYNYTGYDPDLSNIEFCKFLGYNAVSSIDEIDGKFDLVTMYDVIEHLHDPIQALKPVLDKMSRNGKILFYTPNVRSVAFDMMGQYQNQTYPFDHVAFFSEKSIKFLAKKLNLKIKKIEFFGFDLTDYFLFKEYVNNREFYPYFKGMINYLQSILDQNSLSNSMRVILSR